MSTYRELDEKLASLLGWTEHPRLEGKLYSQWKRPSGAIYDGCHPRWTEDDGEAFKLMVEHDLSGVGIWRNRAWVGSADDVFFQCESIDEHESKFAAVRVAIVKAVIAKLEGVQ